MKILKQEREKNIIKLEIEDDVESFAAATKKAYTKVSKEVKIPGFRPGKVPPKVLEQFVGKENVLDEAARDQVSELYPKVIDESKIDPVDYPKVDIVQVEEGKPFIFKIEVEVKPEVKIGEYKGIEVDKNKVEVTDEEVENLVKVILDNRAEYKEVADRNAKDGDIVEVDMKAKAGEEEIQLLSREGAGFLLGKGQLSPEFDEQLLDLPVNSDKQFTVAFPGDHTIKEIAGKEIAFDLIIKKITEKVLPELDDEFSKNFLGMESADKVKEQIRADILQRKTEEEDTRMRNDLIEKIGEGVEVDMPQKMIDREINLMVDELKKSIEQQGFTYDAYLKNINKTEDKIKEEFAESAKKRVKAKLILDQVSKNENIEVTQMDIDLEVKNLADMSRVPMENFQKNLGEAGISYIEDYLLRKKTLDLLVKEAKVTEKA